LLVLSFSVMDAQQREAQAKGLITFRRRLNTLMIILYVLNAGLFIFEFMSIIWPWALWRQAYILPLYYSVTAFVNVFYGIGSSASITQLFPSFTPECILTDTEAEAIVVHLIEPGDGADANLTTVRLDEFDHQDINEPRFPFQRAWLDTAGRLVAEPGHKRMKRSGLVHPEPGSHAFVAMPQSRQLRITTR